MNLLRRALSLLALVLAATTAAALPQGLTFEVGFDAGVQAEPYTGRVYVALSQRTGREPRLGMTSWFNPPPLFAKDVSGVEPGGSVRLAAEALHHPVALADLEPGTWHAQAVARRSPDASRPGQGPGDLYSPTVTFTIAEDRVDHVVHFDLTEVVEPRAFQETERVKLFEHESRLLSDFLGRPFVMRAAVVLPEGWADSEERYPIVYRVPGFGGDHFGALRRRRGDAPSRPVLEVVLDPQCYRGHSVFADSANNGPWGRALVEELIPALERKFRGPLDGRYRFVTGVSSGGWSCLWLQVTYPDAFGACFSHVPDPVDFRDFQRIDLYREGENMFTDAEGEPRPLARRGNQVTLRYKEFVDRETVLGPGGQIHSFEAVFSPRGEDGLPLSLFDRDTGAIDTRVAKSWEPYDIRLVLARNWEELAPKLRGKLHVYAGEVDNFYLEGAVALLSEFFETVENDAVCVTIPGMGHSLHREGEEDMFADLLARWAERADD